MMRELLSDAFVKHNDTDLVCGLFTEQEVIIFFNDIAKIFWRCS